MTIKTFNEFVLDWWNEYLEVITEETARNIMKNEFLDEGEELSDELAYDDSVAHTCKDWLALQNDPKAIYEKFFSFESTCIYDDLPDSETLLVDMFLQAARWYDGSDSAPDFAREFCFEMAYKAQDYNMPLKYFNDLAYGGCQSGMVSALIYSSDCKNIYISHIDDMEEYIEQIEEECGTPLKNKNRLPHYTFVCWICFEELAYSIARNLFPDEF